MYLIHPLGLFLPPLQKGQIKCAFRSPAFYGYVQRSHKFAKSLRQPLKVSSLELWIKNHTIIQRGFRVNTSSKLQRKTYVIPISPPCMNKELTSTHSPLHGEGLMQSEVQGDSILNETRYLQLGLKAIKCCFTLRHPVLGLPFACL